MENEFGKIRKQSIEFKTVQGCMNCVNERTLKEEHRLQNRRKATGIDRVTKEEYGFRKGKNAHQAIMKLNHYIMRKKVNYIVDADIKGFFDNVDHKWLIKFLEHDIEDKRFIRYIRRFLIAGIMENNKFIESDKGTPQGGLISPVLANVYLHYVLDLWFEKKIKKNYKGKVCIVRYADDFVCGFQYKNEAKKFYEELKERLQKFGLELAEDKSKIIPFGRFAKENNRGEERFDFLGFTFINGLTRTNKYRTVILTSKKKLKQKKQNVKDWLKTQRNNDIITVIDKLNKKIVGHYRYYGISGNFKGLVKFYKFIVLALYKMLIRRSQRSYLNLERYYKLIGKHPILKPKLYVNIW